MGGNTSYLEKLRDPRWQRKRLEVMQRDEWSCVRCGRSDATLAVHHRYYENGKDPWDYEDDCYETLCSKCHEKTHTAEEEKEDWDRFFEWSGKYLWELLNEFRLLSEYTAGIKTIHDMTVRAWAYQRIADIEGELSVLTEGTDEEIHSYFIRRYRENGVLIEKSSS